MAKGSAKWGPGRADPVKVTTAGHSSTSFWVSALLILLVCFLVIGIGIGRGWIAIR